MKASELLDKGADLIQAHGHYQGPGTDANNYCALTSLSSIVRLERDRDAWQLAQQSLYFAISVDDEMPGEGIATWNDNTPKAEVIATMRDVAEQLRRKGQ